MGVGPVAGDELVGFGGRLLVVFGNVVSEEDADVVLFDFPLALGGGVEDDVPSLANLGRSGAGNEPSVADAADPAGGGGAASADPYRGRGLEDGLGGDADVVAGEEVAFVGDLVLLPQAAHEDDGLVGAPGAVALGHAAGLVFLGFFLSQPDGGEETSLGEVVQRGDLLGQDHRVAQGQGQHAGAELHPVGVGGDHGEGDYRLQAEAVGDDAVAEPDGVIAVLVADFDELLEEVGVVTTLAECPGNISDGDAHDSSGGLGTLDALRVL